MSTTIAALSTPSGSSAIALVRLSGSECGNLVKNIFNVEPKARKAVFAPYKKLNGEALDDTVHIFYAAPASYTGEDMLEISAHGNPFIIQEMLKDLFDRGCIAAEAGEFTRRAFMNGKMDLSQAEAVAQLIDARSERSLKAAHRQLHGELGKRICAMSEELLDISALVEAYIDFPEDDLPPEDKNKIAISAAEVSKKIAKLAESAKYEHIVHSGLNIVIAGAPNAGKSSLLNALLGSERAIVSPAAGTTRDFISESIMLDGYRANIIDTAGLRSDAGEIEAAGIAKATDKIASCDLCILTIDSSESAPDFSRLNMQYPDASKTIVAINKCDLPNSNPQAIEKSFENFECAQISCAQDNGIENLKEKIVEFINKNRITPAADDILVGARHAQALERAGESLALAAQKIADDIPAELVASDLRDALDALGEIVGKSDNEQILDRIFSKFCIGK